jgi:hypothetical protein
MKTRPITFKSVSHVSLLLSDVSVPTSVSVAHGAPYSLPTAQASKHYTRFVSIFTYFYDRISGHDNPYGNSNVKSNQ